MSSLNILRSEIKEEIKKRKDKEIKPLLEDFKKQLIGFLREKELFYKEEIKKIEIVENEALIDLLDINTLNELKKKVMEIKENKIFSLVPLRPVHDIEVLPQIDGTCWFNALLMVLLYSQGIRQVIIQEVAKWTPDEINGNRFKEFVVYVLKYNYTEPEKIKELFRKKFKTTSLLLSLLKGEKLLETLKENFKFYLKRNVKDYGYKVSSFLVTDNFLSLFLNDYSFVHYNNINKKTTTLQTFNNPKIVIILKTYLNINLSLFSTVVKSEGIGELKETITINGIKYILDASIIDNYNYQEVPLGHVISGITYNNNPYVYNGWTLRKQEREKYYNKRKYACPLFPFDWKLSITERKSNPFCFNSSNCKINEIGEKALCFNFNHEKTETILFYVREDEYKKKTLTLEQEIAKEKLQYSSLSLSSLVREFYKLEEKSNEHLFQQLIELYGEQIIRTLIYELLEANYYSIFYFMLCNSNLSEDKKKLTKEEILKKFYIALLKSYIKKNRKFDFERVVNTKINLYITIKTLKELLKRIGYTEEDINIIIADYKKYLILWYLLNKTVIRIKINFTSIDLLVKILEFVLENNNKFNIIHFDDSEIIDILFELEFKKQLQNQSHLDQLTTEKIEKIEKKLVDIPILKEIKKLLDEYDENKTKIYSIITSLVDLDLKDLLVIYSYLKDRHI